MKICTITNDKGRVFNVKRVDPGEYYGRAECLKAEGIYIEFYDATYSNCGPLGQFVSRYYLKTLAERDPHDGLNLQGGVPEWQIDAAALTAAMWRVARLSADYEAKRFVVSLGIFLVPEA